MKEIAQLSYDARNYTLLNHNIQLLSKKHGQLKAAIQALVELAIGWLPEIKERDGLEKWLELIETLRTVTEGKVRIRLIDVWFASDWSFRSSWKHLELVLPSFLPTTMNHSPIAQHRHHHPRKIPNKPHPTYSQNSKSRHTHRWSDERRLSLFWSRCVCSLPWLERRMERRDRKARVTRSAVGRQIGSRSE